MTEPAQKIAFLFRYGAGEHVDFLPALPVLFAELTSKGHEVHHFGFKGSAHNSESISSEVTIHEGPFKVKRESEFDKRLKAFLWLMLLPWLGRKLQREGFDKVFVDETLPLSAPLLQLGYQGKLFFTVHDFFIEIYWGQRKGFRHLSQWIQKVDERGWRKLEGVFTRVESAKKHLISKGVDPDRITVVPDSVDLNLFRPCLDLKARQDYRVRLGVKPPDVLLVHHGIMHPNKGNLRLVKAFNRLQKRLPQIKLLLIGDGPEMKEVREFVESHTLHDRVLLLEWLPELSDISQALSASDIGLVMRKGLLGDHFHVTSTLVHNLACGLPLLAVRLDGISEVLEEGEQGYLFDPICEGEFDEKLINLVENEPLRVEMGISSRKTAENRFNPDHLAGYYAKGLLE